MREEGVWHMHLVYVARHLKMGEEGEKMKMQEWKKSHNWLPAEDNFQLATVELPSVRQAHDALLVAC